MQCSSPDIPFATHSSTCASALLLDGSAAALSKRFVVVGRITEVAGSKGSFEFIISQH